MTAVRTEHDPLCYEFGNGGWIPGVGDCQCDLIARVRADEALCWHCTMPCCDEDDA